MLIYIREYAETLEQVSAKVGGGINQSVIQENTRVSTLSWIFLNQDSKPIYDFALEKIKCTNFWHFGFKLTGMQALQYTRYPVGGHYRYHNDIIHTKESISRKLSVVVALTPPEEYVGGELMLLPNGDRPTPFKLGLGDMLVFPSYIPHKVKPVVEGNRITLVMWLTGPKFV